MWSKSHSVCTALFIAVSLPAHALSSVGKVTLAIGGGELSTGAGKVRPLAAGVEVFPGDRVVTGTGGHVHIRFLDGGLVSVRPHSKLRVEDYDYRPDQPALSKVRFQLDQGTARSISGAAAEAAKQRFRLNTPLVAIGVRGTDFVVHSTGTQSTTTVNQGAIVVAPFGEGCSLQGVGPCSGAGSMLVTPEMSGLLAEYSPGSTNAQLRRLGPAETTALTTQPTRDSSASLQAQSGAGERGSTTASPLVVGSLNSPSQASAITQDTLALLAVMPVAPPVAAAPTSPPSLAWGRWGEPTFLQDFSVAYAVAREGREVTVANGVHALYRSPDAAMPDAGSVDLSLSQSYAQYKSPSHQLSAASVGDARLNINFSLRNFSTSLTVSSPVVGRQTISGTGSVDSDGIFRSNGADQNIAGAVGSGAASAAYLFDKAVAGGTLSGITLWSK